MTYFKLKRCFDCRDRDLQVATQLLRRDTSFNTKAKKSCRDITNWVTTAQVSCVKSYPSMENGSRHEDRLKADKLCEFMFL